MLEEARDAARLWGLGDAPIALAARRENVVFRVQGADGDFALRFHRPGYRDAAQLMSELQWMAALSAGGLNVPVPVALPDGGLVAQRGEHLVDLLTWLPGEPLGTAGELQGITDRVEFCRALGHVMARMHDVSDAWTPPTEFSRPAWDRDGLLGDAPLWGRFWDHPELSSEDQALLLSVRERADTALAAIQGQADCGLIHADLLSENMLLHEGRVALIDFDDGGWGFRDFELATFLLRFTDAPDYPALRTALCEGYGVRRRVDDTSLDLFLLLRALTYPGWIMDRLCEPGARARSERAIGTAVHQARRWLKKYGG